MRVKRRAPLKSCCSNKRKRRRITNSAGVPAGTCICCRATVPTPGRDSHRGHGTDGSHRAFPRATGCRPVESARRNRGGGPVRESVRPTLPVVGVVLAVVAPAPGAGVVQAMIGIPAQEAGSGHGADQPAAAHRADPTTLLDLGQVSSSEKVATCLSPSFAADPSQVQVLYGVQQRAVSGSSPVFVLRNRSGALRLCDEFGGEPPSQSPLPSLSDTRPVAFLSNGRSTWRCDGQALRRLQMTSWLLVSPDVRTVQQRYWVDGTPGPWFTTRAQSGFAHLQSWLTGRHRAGAKYATQYRVT